MTEAQIKEQISKNYIEVLAARCGCKVNRPLEDFGVDLHFEKPIQYKAGDKIRYLDSGQIIGCQLKCTSGKIAKNGEIKFVLDQKNYNDLIIRKNARLSNNSFVPLILMVLVLPKEIEKWVSFNRYKTGVRIGGKAYWFYPNNEMVLTESTKKTISLSTENQVDLSFFDNIFKLHFKNLK